MSRTTLSLLQYLRITAGALHQDTRTDAELLSHYVKARDETAFAALVVRHGALVWNVCHQILGNLHDVEDAFQGTFLVLSRQANKVHTGPLAGWLHQVARRAALNVRNAAAARQRNQEQLRAMLHQEVTQQTERTETYVVLHDELGRLSEKLRVPLVLHYLEGKTKIEVARILGVSEAAIRKRLARGESILRERLSPRGIDARETISAILLQGASLNVAISSSRVRRTLEATMAFRNGTLSGNSAELARQVIQSLSYGTGWWVLKGWLVALVCAGGLAAGAFVWKAVTLPLSHANTSGNVVVPAKETSPEPSTEQANQARMDVYGDPLPERALARLGTLRLRNSGAGVLTSGGGPAVLFSLDGKMLITAGEKNPPWLWDVATGKLLRQLSTAQQFSAGDMRENSNVSMTLSSDKNTLATLEQGGRVSLWDISTGKSRTLSSNFAIRTFAFSTDGKTLTTVRRFGGDLLLHVWEVASGKELRQHNLSADPDDAQVFALSPDGGKLVAVGEKRKVIQSWEVATGKRLHRSEIKDAFFGTSSKIFFSPDGRLVAIVSPQWDGDRVNEGTVHLWDVATGKKVRQFGSDKAGTFCVVFSPDSKLLATGSGAGSVRLWDVATGKELHSCQGYRSHVESLAFSPDGKLLASGANGNDYTARIWEVATGKEVSPHFGGHTSAILSVTFTPDGKSLISGGRDGTVGLWNAETGRERRAPLRAGDFQSPAALSPDGKTIVAIGHTFTPNEDSILNTVLESPTTIRFWDATTGQERRQWAGPVGCAQSIQYSSDGKALLSVTFGSGPTLDAHLWDSATGKELCQFDRTVADHPLCGVFYPQGKTFCVLNGDGVLSFCSLATGKSVGQYRAQKECFLGSSFSFSPDGQMLAAAGKEEVTENKQRVTKYTISLQRVPSDNNAKTSAMFIEQTGAIYALAFSPDGKTLASAGKDGTLRLWEVATGKERCSFKGHQGEIWCLAFAPDGRRLASGSNDTTILIWDVTARLDHGRLRSEPLPIKQVERLWNDLASADAVCAGQAIWKLAAAPQQAVSFFKKQIRPIPVDKMLDQRIAQLVGELDDNSFKVRKKALDELKKLGPLAEPGLRQALKSPSSAEAKKRLKELLSLIKHTLSLNELRWMRAVEALEQCHTPEARQLLEELAQGKPSAPLTLDAQAALKRWGR